uniref:Uncharacterized protein n=1 Tax=Globisporangium ultimum (strain ATCC 200006 / CBS 805.95 / DAOM BR144) TaxID=431595 RepID=K3WNQ2_GLOUD
MMRISDLLNNNNTAGDNSDEEEVAQIVGAPYDNSFKLRRAISAHAYEPTHEGDDGFSSGAEDTGRLSETTHYASSLLDALSLQSMAKLNSKRSPTALSSSSSSTKSPQTHYLSIENLTNPDDEEGEMKQEHASAKEDASNAQQAQSKKRSTRSLFPEATDSDRRAKQRMIVKRCYYKKINTIKSLREEVQNLEQQFHAAIQARQESSSKNKDDDEENGDASKLSDLYIQSLTVKESLRKENQRLRRLADEYYMKNQGRLRILLDSNKKGITLFTPALEN